jgi:RNA polymerase sigma-32 factor
MNKRMLDDRKPDSKNKKATSSTAKSKKAAEKEPEYEARQNADAESEVADDAGNEAEDIELVDSGDDEDLFLADAELDFSQDDEDEGELVETAALVPASKASDRVGDSLTLYLREISRFPMLTPEEEYELAHRVKGGDSDAAFRLVSSHLRLVVKIAMGFQRRWMQNVLDLIQEGNVGLMRATHKFDPEKGIKFSYYAAFWVRAYILKFIMDNWRLVKIGTTQSQRKLFYNLNKERQRLIAQGFEPDMPALAARLNVNEAQVEEMSQRLESFDVSLDAPLNEEAGGATRLDMLPSTSQETEDVLADEELAAVLRKHVHTLTRQLSKKELDILNNRLLSDDPVTLREIGAKYNITRERVRQIETRLLQKLKTHLTNEIKDFSEEWLDE